MDIIIEKIVNYELLIRELFHLRKFPVLQYAIIVQGNFFVYKFSHGIVKSCSM